MPRVPLALAVALVASALAAGSVPVAAAGIERAVPSVRTLFREGNWAEFSLTQVRPHLRGRDANLAPVAGQPFSVEGGTGDIFESYTVSAFTIKGVLGERASYAVIIDEPWGADTVYGTGTFDPQPPLPFSYAGTFADIESRALSTILAYDITPRVKVYGGLRAQRTEAAAAVPFFGDYTIDTDADWSLGWLAGAGYQIPEIALNVSLTYYSRVRHAFDTLEFGAVETATVVETPRSINLEFQSGVAADTLVFGSVRWVEWSDFTIAPPQFIAATGAPLVDYENDYWTYTLGVGRRFSERWSGVLQAIYEPGQGGTLTTLGPVDGRTVLGGGLTYALGGAEITGTLAYGWLGDAENVLDTRFRDGTVTSLGLRLGTTF